MVINTYFFPTGSKKAIPVHEIRAVYYKKQECLKDLFRTKDWGMTLSPVWWACDLHRHIHFGEQHNGHYNVVLDCGTGMKKGFTVQNINAFLGALRPHTQATFTADIPSRFPAVERAAAYVSQVNP